MVMAPNPYTGTDRPPSPEEIAVLNRIAQLRAAGFDDSMIFSGGLGQSLSIPTGTSYLPFLGDLAATQSSYNLGRGNLALGAADLGYQMQQNPFNIISALQFQRDTGAPGVLTDPTLANVPPSPMSKYLGYIDNLLSAESQAGGGTGGGSTTSADTMIPGTTTRQSGQKALPDITYSTDMVPTAAPVTTTPITAFDPLATQRAASTLLGNSGIPGAPIGETQLQAGNVPGFASFTDRQMGLMSPDQRAAYFGLVGSTGRTSDPMAAYRQYQQTYGHRGVGGIGRTIR